ncbi:K+-transporting ATPase KdpF subunit [Actinoalloteichus hoggarensis]|uniref:F subunit of K+-transporting ATPase (Potass_KdpF) n=1 Tax=Actinoalloteichus hoggarensis TaxID=1470176 RepID=A0A221W9K0_9PSEU|nr:K(+)-transporting ATPase subunit F [Actinoalloteichus hoggarensis]ASO22306.1 F subunit of K+-transporting ATPase (Potass_KdpF) [Actinoalloteichus hoggarensis]MBB5923275.1 K+-transporting ATPase KdpF subunit [Actinoalloteichus hoggarensis]
MTGAATSVGADLVAGALALLSIGYLVYALIRPERF